MDEMLKKVLEEAGLAGTTGEAPPGAGGQQEPPPSATRREVLLPERPWMVLAAPRGSHGSQQSAAALDQALPERQQPKIQLVNTNRPLGAAQPPRLRPAPQPPTAQDHPAHRLPSACGTCLICRLWSTGGAPSATCCNRVSRALRRSFTFTSGRGFRPMKTPAPCAASSSSSS